MKELDDFRHFSRPFCQRQSASSGLVPKNHLDIDTGDLINLLLYFNMSKKIYIRV